ncbi:MAG: hypothetical protein WA322_26150 [Pseudolabrys sp.]
MSGAHKRDPLLEMMIDDAVLGDKASPWDIDPDHPPDGSLQDRFNAGDKQILLWAIHFSARKRNQVPEWAAKALAEVVYEAAVGEFDSWDEAFGRIFKKKKRATMYQKARHMIDAYNRVIELNREDPKANPRGNILFARVGEELHIGKNNVSKYYARVRDYVKSKKK